MIDLIAQTSTSIADFNVQHFSAALLSVLVLMETWTKLVSRGRNRQTTNGVGPQQPVACGEDHRRIYNAHASHERDTTLILSKLSEISSSSRQIESSVKSLVTLIENRNAQT